MTNTQIHPVKRVITFIMALLMVLSSIVYFDIDSYAMAYPVSSGSSTWKTYFDIYHYTNKAFYQGLADWNTLFNPFSVSSNQIVAKTNTALLAGQQVHDKFMVAASNGTSYPGGFRITVNINTNSSGTLYYATGSQTTADTTTDSKTLTKGAFSIAALTEVDGDVKFNADAMTDWEHGVRYGLGKSAGLVFTFRSNAASRNYYEYCCVYLNGDLQSIVKLNSNAYVYCNGSTDTTIYTERIGKDHYEFYVSNGTGSQLLYTLNGCRDDLPLRYGVGSFATGDGTRVSDGSFTIKTVGTCSNSAIIANSFSGNNGHKSTFDWVNYNNDSYRLKECSCGYFNQKRIVATYDPNGGTSASSKQDIWVWNTEDASSTYKFTPTPSVTPTRDGYDFLGWSASKTATTPTTSFTYGNSVTLYAVWKQADVKYDLTLNAGDGAFSDGSKTKTYPISYGQTYKSAFGNSFPTPVLRGYTFDYYDYNNGQYGLDSSNWEDGYGLNSDGTMYAKYLPNNPYTLTFNDWGSTTSVSFLQGQQIRDFTTLPQPTREGYDFKGWFTAESGGTQITNTYAPNGNTTIYAQWQGKQQTLVLDAIASIESPSEIQGKKRGTFSDGSTSMSVTIRTGQKYDDVDALTPMPCPTIRGYSFYGWYYSGGTYVLNSNYDWEDKSYNIPSGATFTATYKPNDQYVLKFDAATNGGTLSGTTQYEFLSGMYISDVVSSLPTPASRESEGLRFKGWYTDATGGSKITNLNEPLTKNTTYYAQWEKIPYILTLNPNGGSFADGTTANKTYEIYNGDLYKDINGLDPMPNPTKPGYDFIGWGIGNGNLDNPLRYNAPNWKDDDSFESTQNLTFYAVWDLHTYTITFDPNGGTMPSGYTTNPYPVKFKASISNAVGGYPIPTKEGYTFKGWTAYKDMVYEYFWSKETQWTSYPNFELYLDAVMVAEWESTPYTLTFNTNGGELSTSKYNKLTNAGNDQYTVTIYKGDSYIDAIYETVPIPTWKTEPKRQYRFDGWSLTPDGDVFWKPNSTDDWSGNTYPGDNLNVYAKWTKLASYKLTFDLNDENTGRAKMPSAYTRLDYTFYDGELLNTVFDINTDPDTSFPIPTRPGHDFLYWEVVPDSTGQPTGEQWPKAWGTYQDYSWKENVTMRAVWKRKTTYKIFFDLNGGELAESETYKLEYDSAKAQYYVEMAKDEYYDDIIGGFPKPTKTNWKFAGWKYTHNDGTEYLWKDSWSTSVGAQLGDVSGDVTLVAQWGILSCDITFHATGTGCARIDYDYYVINNNQPKWTPTPITANGATVNGDTSYTIEIAVNEYFKDKGEFPVPEYDGYVFEYWYGSYVLNGTVHQVKITREMWENDAYDKGIDLELYAYYRCNHMEHEYSWDFEDDQGHVYSEADHDSALDPTAVNRRIYLRHHGVCGNCEQIAAFGYNVQFLARDNYEFQDYGGRRILLSAGVPLIKQFELTGGGYNADRGFVIDYLDDGINPKIKVKFDPVLKAAKNNNGLTCWIVDYTTFGHRDDDYKNHILDGGRSPEWEFDYKDMSFSDDNELHSSHLRLIAGYGTGCDEMLFDSTTSIIDSSNKAKGEVKSSSIVDSGMRYGILPIKYGQSYQSQLNYIPIAKQIAVYNYSEPFEFLDMLGVPGSYSQNLETLYCSVGWRDEHKRLSLYIKEGNNTYYTYSLLHSSTWEQTYPLTGGFTNDIKVNAFFIGKKGEESSRGIAQGSLATFYANNKEASVTYNKAYYDFNENSGGTMLYKYYQSGSTWKCEPLFNFDPANKEDYILLYLEDIDSDADVSQIDWSKFIMCYPTGDSSKSNIFSSVPSANIKTFDPEVDFNYNNFKSDGKIIIAKEPKRYTYYMGEGGHYVFPKPVNDPSGVPYTAFGGNFSYGSGGDVKNPEISDKLLTDRNNNTYYLDIDVPGNQEGNFILSRTSGGFPVMKQYSIHAKWASYYPSGQTATPLPLGFPIGLFNCKVDNDFLGTTVYPYGHLLTYYLPAAGYEDYNDKYGDENIRLSYPEGSGYTHYYYQNSDGTVSALPDDMQGSFYNAWDFAAKFNANYPAGVNVTDIGCPGAAIGLKTQDGITVTKDQIKTDSKGNHFVYMFLHQFGDTVMPGRNLFTCDGYYIDEWEIFVNGTSTGKRIKARDVLDPDDAEDEHILDPYEAAFYAKQPGAEFRAVWKRAVNFTVVEGEEVSANGTVTSGGNDPFANVKYYDVYTGAEQTLKPNVTTTVMVKENSVVSLGGFSPASNSEYAYLTLNNNDVKLKADRIITNSGAYSFRIVDDTAMTVQFVPKGTSRGFYIDRNNKLLKNNADAWRLYTKLPTRTPAGVADDASLNNALYYTYNNTTTYNITVSGSTYTSLNVQHKNIPYDDVFTVMTGPKNSSGAKFVGWQIGSQFVSYDLVYKHRVTSAETITAVYADSAIANVSIVEKGNDGNVRDFFVSQYVLPESCTLIETGFIVTKKDDATITFDDLYNADGTVNTNYHKIVSTNTDDSGTFKLLVPESGTHYVVAYVYYVEGNQTNVKYSARSNQ